MLDVIGLSDICLPSYDDIVAITGLTEPDALADACLRRGARTVALKLGADGALVADATGRVRIPPHPCRPVDATGAGDTFGGAFLARCWPATGLRRRGAMRPRRRRFRRKAMARSSPSPAPIRCAPRWPPPDEASRARYLGPATRNRLMTELVRLEREGACGVIVIDNPPVNVTSQGVRAGLLAAVGALAADPTLTAGVVIGAGRTFVSGADLKEFGQPFAPPETPEVMAAIAACPKPLVAALHGTAMGGGFELALACDARIGTVDLLVALPEVKLGVIPGAGGTQRTPRLIGVAKAIEFVASGRRMKAAEALSLGLIDRIAERDLRTEAIAFALSRPGKRDLAEVPVPPEPAEAIEAAAKAALAKGRGRPFIAKAVEAVRWSATTPLAEGLQQEREAFQELRTAEEAFALRHLFFAEREAGASPKRTASRPPGSTRSPSSAPGRWAPASRRRSLKPAIGRS